MDWAETALLAALLQRYGLNGIVVTGDGTAKEKKTEHVVLIEELEKRNRRKWYFYRKGISNIWRVEEHVNGQVGTAELKTNGSTEPKIIAFAIFRYLAERMMGKVSPKTDEARRGGPPFQ